MKKSIILIVVSLIIASIIPFFAGNFTLRLATDILIFAIMASSWNIIGGYAGYASFGNIVFFGLGAYVTSLLMVHLNMNFFVAMLIGGIVSAIFGYVVGLPMLRLKGHYFAIGTLGLAEAVKALVQNLDITEGNAGIYTPIPDMPVDAFYHFFYYTSLAVLIILLFVTYRILKSKFGYGLIAIREDEDAANSMGINTTLFKSLAFSLSGFFTGMAGGIYAYQQGFIKPDSVFAVSKTVEMIVMSVFGGIGSIFGPLIGSVSIELITNYLSSSFLVAHGIFFGTIVIVIILFAPKGIYDIISGRKKIGISYFLKNMRRNKI